MHIILSKCGYQLTSPGQWQDIVCPPYSILTSSVRIYTELSAYLLPSTLIPTRQAKRGPGEGRGANKIQSRQCPRIESVVGRCGTYRSFQFTTSEERKCDYESMGRSSEFRAFLSFILLHSSIDYTDVEPGTFVVADTPRDNRNLGGCGIGIVEGRMR